MVIVLLGPMGCGKSTIGTCLANRLDWHFYDADDYHSETNKQKMAREIPLDDQDREPWLLSLWQIIQNHLDADKSMILACSALKEKYRKILGVDQQEVYSVYLKGSFSLLATRIAVRSHEFMNKNLLQSQLDTLEEPETGLIVDITDTPEAICQTIIHNLIN